MKVLIIQENGRHEKNRSFRECFCLQRGFEKLNHKADVWGLGHDSYSENPDYESYDLITLDTTKGIILNTFTFYVDSN